MINWKTNARLLRTENPFPSLALWSGGLLLHTHQTCSCHSQSEESWMCVFSVVFIIWNKVSSHKRRRDRQVFSLLNMRLVLCCDSGQSHFLVRCQDEPWGRRGWNAHGEQHGEDKTTSPTAVGAVCIKPQTSVLSFCHRAAHCDCCLSCCSECVWVCIRHKQQVCFCAPSDRSVECTNVINFVWSVHVIN